MQAKGIVVRRRGKTLIGPIDLTVGAEGITAVLGPNGAGKTTLLKALHGLEKINSGHLHWQAETEVVRRQQAYVFQTPVLLRRSVERNLGYPLEMRGVSKAEIAEGVASWSDRIGLRDARQRPANQLSGGERQKLALARALIIRPQLLFLDEPCTNLDGASTRDIETLLLEAQQAGTKIIIATHDLGQARRLAMDGLFLLDGKIHEAGPAPALFDTPQTPELRAFLAGDIVA
jgi:tungstate transport system ATP-binding protein